MSELPYYGRGANDTAGAYGSIIHGTPDPVQLNVALTNQQPLYPTIDASKPSYQKAWKGLFAFTDEGVRNRPRGAGSADTDHVWFMMSLNGLYNKLSDAPYRLAERLNPLGITEDDVLAAEGPSQNTTILVTGKATTANTGPLTIRAQQHFYLDFPSTDPAKMYTGGCSNMEGVPEKFLTPWTMPYNPQIHRATPRGLYRFYSDGTITQSDSDFGQKENAGHVVDAAIDTAIVALAMLEKERIISDAVLLAAIKRVKENDFKERFTKCWLDPVNHLLGEVRDLPPIVPQANSEIYAGGSLMEPSSILASKIPRPSGRNFQGSANLMSGPQAPNPQQQILHSQIVASENFFFYTNNANRYFTRRIVGKSENIVDPGKNMDCILIDGNGSN